jgi:hypothetical protein
MRAITLLEGSSISSAKKKVSLASHDKTRWVA